MAAPSNYLIYCSYAIAVLDLISVLLYGYVSIQLLLSSSHWSAIAAIVFSIFWLAAIVVLFIGIQKRRVSYVRTWLIFTCFGVAIDAILLIYGFCVAISLDFDGFRNIVLPFLGLTVEMTFVYIIYMFYGDMTNDKSQKRCWCCRSRSSQPAKKKDKKKRDKRNKSRKNNRR